ncbi:hypothetical protein C8F04DRAFT_98511 [Mycena alexandri]|uniref:Uncharacterized protein n=1 Tax=Mycena alexandri TaxID=1745969 RepID=A0AAD6TB37_9AGAR|nr:hypothetical protein C8F04DRAFT_98511 [Mycena alexandri]
MSNVEAHLPALYTLLKGQLYSAAAALFFNGICLLLFSFAVFFLLKTKTRASQLFLTLAVIMVLFAITQAILDVAIAAAMSNLVENLLATGSTTQVLSLEQRWARMYIAREGLLAFNNAITDGVLLYRCAVIWASSPFVKVVVAIPSLLILSTFGKYLQMRPCRQVSTVLFLGLGIWGTFVSTSDTVAPYVMALVTNSVLLALSAGKIWRKGRQASVVLGPEARQRYTNTVEIICESSLLYLLNVVIYMIAEATQTSETPIVGLSWGSLAQVVNIVPMMIMVRVGIAKSLGEPEPTRVFYGGNARSDRFGMEDRMTVKGGAKYSKLQDPNSVMDD